MKNPVTKQNWLEKAYEHFAEVGPEQLSFKKIASEIGHPRTSFYYHFADKDDLCEQLLQMHFEIAENFFQILNEQCKNLMPDFYMMIEQFPVSLKFHRQLFLNLETAEYGTMYKKVHNLLFPFIIPLVKEHFNLNVPFSTMEKLWDTVTYTWYARIDVKQINSKAMSILADEIMVSVLKFAKLKI